MSVIDCSKCIHCEVCGNRYANDGCAGECSYFLEYNPSGDCISRSVLDEIRQLYKNYQPNLATEVVEFGNALEELIDNAPPVDIKDQIAGAYNEGYMCGNKEAEKARPKGKWELHGMIYYCSECGHDCGESGDNFCGNCGAEMQKGGKEHGLIPCESEADNE